MLKRSLSNTWVRSIILVLTFFFLAFLFVSPGVRYAEKPSVRDSERLLKLPLRESKTADEIKIEHQKALAELPLSDPRTDELIKIEHQKAVDEIKLHMEEQDSWYHYKFILIGGMFALFLGQTGLSIGRRSPSGRKFQKWLLATTSNYSILALAVVIALVIDMHIRSDMFGIQTIGLWIAYYVEPSYPSTTVFPWEQFLRDIHSPSINLDSLYKLGYSLHLHYMTIAIYLLYVIVLQQICLTFNKRSGKGTKQFIIFGFLLVHLASAAFVFVAHAVPGAYEMNLIPLERWESGWRNVGYYLIPWLLLVAINLPYLILIRNKKSNESERPNLDYPPG